LAIFLEEFLNGFYLQRLRKDTNTGIRLSLIDISILYHLYPEKQEISICFSHNNLLSSIYDTSIWIRIAIREMIFTEIIKRKKKKIIKYYKKAVKKKKERNNIYININV